MIFIIGSSKTPSSEIEIPFGKVEYVVGEYTRPKIGDMFAILPHPADPPHGFALYRNIYAQNLKV